MKTIAVRQALRRGASDVLPATKNYSLAWNAIVRHVEEAIDLLATEPPAPRQARHELK